MPHRTIAALLILTTAGCTTMGPVANPREFIPIKRPAQVRLTRTDGKVLVMYHPAYIGDSLSGVVRGEGQRSIPRRDITGVEAMVPAWDKTRLIVIGGGAVAILSLAWAIRKIDKSSLPPNPRDFCDFDDGC